VFFVVFVWGFGGYLDVIRLIGVGMTQFLKSLENDVRSRKRLPRSKAKEAKAGFARCSSGVVGAEPLLK